MTDDPCPPGSLNVDVDYTPVSGVRRLRWVYLGVLCMFIILIPIHASDRRLPEPDLLNLFVLIMGGLLFAAWSSRDILRLHSSKLPLWVDIFGYLVVTGFVCLYIALNELHIWRWSKLYIDIPAVVFLGITTTVTWVTETRNNVRIYMGSRTLIFRFFD